MLLRSLTMNPKRMNKLASMSMLPLMAFAIVLGSRAAQGTSIPVEAPREGTLVVANLRDDTLTIHNLDGDGGQTTLAMNGTPHELEPIGNRLLVTLPREGRIFEVEPHAPGILRTVDAPGQPHGIDLAGDTFYVSFDEANTVSAFDAATLLPGDWWYVGQTPHSLAANGGYLYVTDSRDGMLRRLDPESGEAVTAPAGALAESVTVAGSHVVTANANAGTVSIFDAETLELERTIETGGQPVRTITLSDSQVAVVLASLNRVQIIDVDSGETVKRLNVPEHPDGVCLSPSGRFLAVTSNGMDLVQVYRTTDWKLMVNLATGDGPGACAWMGE